MRCLGSSLEARNDGSSIIIHVRPKVHHLFSVSPYILHQRLLCSGVLFGETGDDIRFARHYDQSAFCLIRWNLKDEEVLRRQMRNDYDGRFVQYHSKSDLVATPI